MVSTSDITPDKLKVTKITKQKQKKKLKRNIFPNFKFLSSLPLCVPTAPPSVSTYPPLLVERAERSLPRGIITMIMKATGHIQTGRHASIRADNEFKKKILIRIIFFLKIQQGSNFSFVVKSFLRVPQQIALWCKKKMEPRSLIFFFSFFFLFVLSSQHLWTVT